jgi:cell division protein FtsB
MKKKLTKAEIETRAEELAGKVIDLEKAQAKRKEKMKALKAIETDLEFEIAELAVEVKNGEEEVDDQDDAFPETKTKKKGGNLSAVKEPPVEEEEEPKH